MRDYWNHNVAYHNWILKQIKQSDTVLDVGCGDGLLVQKLSDCCKQVIGIEPHLPSAEKAQNRVEALSNAAILNVSFDDYTATGLSIDVILFVASIHHMELDVTLEKAKQMLSPDGQIIIVGCAKMDGIMDGLIELLRIVPAKVGSLLHGEKNGGEIGVPTQSPALSMKKIQEVVGNHLPNAQLRRGLYYRYLLSWHKTDTF